MDDINDALNYYGDNETSRQYGSNANHEPRDVWFSGLRRQWLKAEIKKIQKLRSTGAENNEFK
jgi:hypothetical protein